MGLTKDEFFQTWLAAQESQEQHVVETAWERYQHTQASTYTTDPEASDPDAKTFESHFGPFLSSPEISSSIRTTKFLTHHANTLPWTATGLQLQPGQQVSTFATGRLWRSRALDLYIGPQFALWFRVGVNGEVFNSTRDSKTFTTEKGGELYLANQLPGWFQDKSGRVVGDLSIYEKGGDGKLEILLIVWKDGVDVPKLLSSHVNNNSHALIKTESTRPSEEKSTNLPPEWYYFWFLGKSTLYTSPSSPSDNPKSITCKPAKGIGILMKDLTPTPPFSKNCILKWSWNISSLPSRLREDTTFSHDYFSVAVEFENGRDITYTWSYNLPVDYGYWCPLSTWEAREYHVVIRSGIEGLGEWWSEERDLYADYERYIGAGGGMPTRIVRVWLISNAVFQRLEGEMTVRGIEIVDGDGGTVDVL